MEMRKIREVFRGRCDYCAHSIPRAVHVCSKCKPLEGLPQAMNRRLGQVILSRAIQQDTTLEDAQRPLILAQRNGAARREREMMARVKPEPLRWNTVSTDVLEQHVGKRFARILDENRDKHIEEIKGIGAKTKGALAEVGLL